MTVEQAPDCEREGFLDCDRCGDETFHRGFELDDGDVAECEQCGTVVDDECIWSDPVIDPDDGREDRDG